MLQALGDLLKTTHRGYFIPPRPEKNPVEGQRASTDFVVMCHNKLCLRVSSKVCRTMSIFAWPGACSVWISQSCLGCAGRVMHSRPPWGARLQDGR